MADLRKAGITAADLMEDYTLDELVSAGYTEFLREAGAIVD